MTTQLIPATSSAPSIRELALREFARLESEYETGRLHELRERVAESEERLRIMLRDVLGVTDAEITTAIPESEDPSKIDTRAWDALSDLWFSLRKQSHQLTLRLHVQIGCGRKCGKELWVEVDGLKSLAYALNTERHHNYQCLVRYDEDGNATTDSLGNPLPPREPTPARLSMEEQARQAINLLERAAAFAASAHNYVAELEDARALIKPAAIKRLMESGTATSATAAERIVESDPEYAAHRAKQRDGEVRRWNSLAAFEAVKLRAQLAVGLATADAMRSV